MQAEQTACTISVREQTVEPITRKSSASEQILEQN